MLDGTRMISKLWLMLIPQMLTISMAIYEWLEAKSSRNIHFVLPPITNALPKQY